MNIDNNKQCNREIKLKWGCIYTEGSYSNDLCFQADIAKIKVCIDIDFVIFTILKNKPIMLMKTMNKHKTNPKQLKNNKQTRIYVTTHLSNVIRGEYIGGRYVNYQFAL